MMINEAMSIRRLYLLGLHWERAIPYYKQILSRLIGCLAAD